jgi:hypothetical protein
MQIILIIIGAVVGMWLGDGSDEVLGFGLGAGIGFLLGQVRSLKLQLDRLQDRITRLVRDQETEASPTTTPLPARTAEAPPAPDQNPRHKPKLCNEKLYQ